MEPLLGMTPDELRQVVSTLGLPKYTASQIARWLYVKRVSSIDEMTDLSKVARQRLAEQYVTGVEQPVGQAVSTDGTIRYLFPTHTGRHIEAVYIPDHDRATLCVSSQVGCKMACRFCMTGRQGHSGQLSAAQILGQVMAIPQTHALTNIVLMGMGEPLDNWPAVQRALECITAPWGMAWSPKRVTLSTIGLTPHLPDFLAQSQCHLAISLHSPFPDERLGLMPVERAYPIADVVELLRRYDWSHQRHLTFEYIVFGGLNDDARHARALASLLSGLHCKVNLIRFHSIPDTDLRPADTETMERLRDLLTRHGLPTTIRASRGEDVYAACGMLSSLAR